MKKLILTFCLAVAATGLFAQGLSGGLKAGLNIANVGGDDADGTDARLSYHFGGYVNLGITDKLSLQPELLLNNLGFKESGNDPDFGDFETTQKQTYLSIPVNLQYSFGVINVFAGPQFSFLLKSESTTDLDGASFDVDTKDAFKGLDLGANIGLGANFGKFNASARYTLGLSNVVDVDDVNVKNNVIQISLGYRLFGGE